jgi:hypothetical protein
MSERGTKFMSCLPCWFLMHVNNTPLERNIGSLSEKKEETSRFNVEVSREVTIEVACSLTSERSNSSNMTFQ